MSNNSSTKTAQFTLGNWLVDPSANTIIADENIEVVLEHRIMSLLVYLSKNAGQVVESGDILNNVWPNVVVSENSLYQSIAQLRKVLGDNALKPTYIETIPKKGYRIIAEVNWTAESRLPPDNEKNVNTIGYQKKNIHPDNVMKSHISHRQKTQNKSLSYVVSGLILIILGIFIYVYWDQQSRQTESTDRQLKSIAVLSFKNVSEDQNNEYLAVGISDEVHNMLSRVPGLNVASQTSSSAIKMPLDVRRIGEILNVESVLEGTVRKHGSKIRIAVQLVSTDDGFQLWSGVYDREFSDIFMIESEISENIIHSLHANLSVGYSPDLMTPDTANVEAYDFYLLGKHYVRDRTSESLARSATLLGKGLRIDDDYAPLYASLAKVMLLQYEYSGVEKNEAILKAELLLDKAIKLAPNHPETLATYGLLEYYQGNYKKAGEYLATAIEYQPSFAIANMWMGLSLAYQGRVNDAQSYYERAYSLDPLNKTVVLNLAHNLYFLGRNEEAIRTLSNAIEASPESVGLHLGLSQLAWESGQSDLSINEARRVLEIDANNLTLPYFNPRFKAGLSGSIGYLINKGGSYTLKIVLDPMNVIDESNETDNIFEKLFM